MTSTIQKQIKLHHGIILKGTLLAIDPATGSSSDAGFAVFKKGKLITSGTIPINKKNDIYTRLRELHDWLATNYNTEIDVLAIEKIRHSHNSLRWSVCAIFLGCRAPVVIEVPPITWHKNVSKAYKKSDQQDAIEIGIVTIKLAKGK